MVKMDTDSAYCALSAYNIDDLIKFHLLETYNTQLFGNCSDVQNDNVEDLWFPRRCCQRHNLFDKRTPGLFKLEFSGSEMI